MIYSGKSGEYIQLGEGVLNGIMEYDKGLALPLVFVWLRDDHNEISIDGKQELLPGNTMICLTVFNKLELNSSENIRHIKFNKEFYCVLQHDAEVSCKGILFYNTNQLPYFHIPEQEVEKFELLWKVFQSEMLSKDDMQLEMLQVLLKRFIILCTRVYKSQNQYDNLAQQESDIVREYNFLVEQHFKTKHTVAEYADMLHKSPKTLSNLFNKLNAKSPLQIIHERKALEARRMLRYTDAPVKEIAYELGFEDIQTFSRFFKKIENMSPTEFKNQILGKIVNSQGNLT